jgi:integrase/recombinase XerD
MIKYYNLSLPDIKSALFLIEDFKNHQIIRKLSKSTLDLYMNEATLFFSIFSPAVINQQYLNDYLLDFGDISKSYRNSRSSALRTILKYLVKNGFSNCNLKIYYVKPDLKLPTFLSEDKIKSMIDTFKKKKLKCSGLWRGRRDYALLLFMYATGLRASEISKFTFDDLDKGWIRVENGKG